MTNIIREAKEQDIPFIVKLINLAYEDSHWFKQPCYYERTSVDAIRDYLKNGKILIIEEKACVCLIENNNRIVNISMLSVHPDHQKKGIAKQMMDYVHNLYSEWTFQLEVVDLQPHLINFYSKIGYKQTGKITAWKELGIDEQTNIKIPSHLIVMMRTV